MPGDGTPGLTSVRGTTHALINRSACETTRWQFIAWSRFEPRLDNSEASVCACRLSCQPWRWGAHLVGKSTWFSSFVPSYRNRFNWMISTWGRWLIETCINATLFILHCEQNLVGRRSEGSQKEEFTKNQTRGRGKQKHHISRVMILC